MKIAHSAMGVVAVLVGSFATNVFHNIAHGQELPERDTTPIEAAAPDGDNAERYFVIRYNPNAEDFDRYLFEDTISDIIAEGCAVSVETRRYGADYTLKAPWFRGGNSFHADDIGTAGGIAIDLCRDGEL